MCRIILVAALALSLTAGAQAQTNTLSLPDTAGVGGHFMSIPLRADFASAVSGLTFSMLFDDQVIQIMGVSTAGAFEDFSLETHLTVGHLRVAMAGADPRDGAGPVLALQVVLAGGAGTTTRLDLHSAVLNEGDDDVSTQDGLVSILRRARISGEVVYRAAGRPVPDTAVNAHNLADDTEAEATTNASGSFNLGLMPPGIYRLSPARSTVEPDAIDVLDVSDILRYLVGAVDLADGARLAADVSGNGRAGTNDAALILRYLVGLEEAFPAGPFWQFQPGEAVVHLLQDEVQDFTAYLLGDVDGDWQEAQPPAKAVALQGPSLRLGPPRPTGSTLTRFPLAASHLTSLRGGELRLTYDPRHLEAAAVWATDRTDGFLFVTNLSQPGLVRIAFAGAAEIEGGADLLHLDFRELGTSGQATPITIEAASLNGISLGVEALEPILYVLGSAHDDPPTAVGGAPTALPVAATLAAAYPQSLQRRHRGGVPSGDRRPRRAHHLWHRRQAGPPPRHRHARRRPAPRPVGWSRRPRPRRGLGRVLRPPAGRQRAADPPRHGAALTAPRRVAPPTLRRLTRRAVPRAPRPGAGAG